MLRTVLPIFLSMVDARGAAAAELTRELAAGRFQHFVTRQGHELYDGDQPFRFVGANMPGLILPYDYTLSLPERLTLPTPWEQ